VALDELLLALADRELPRFRAAGRTLTIELPAEDTPTACLMAETDADQLTTLLLNLLDNARKHARPGTGVTLRLQAEAGKSPVIGLENELATPLGSHLAQLTTAWYQADPLAPGTGLGLWIAGRLSQNLGLGLTLQEESLRLRVALRFPAYGRAA
jgi:signal transduction histidine kinase